MPYHCLETGEQFFVFIGGSLVDNGDSVFFQSVDNMVYVRVCDGFRGEKVYFHKTIPYHDVATGYSR